MKMDISKCTKTKVNVSKVKSYTLECLQNDSKKMGKKIMQQRKKFVEK